MGEPTPDLEELLEGLAQLPIEELRSRKASCEQVEGELSYIRRMVQGRLDIVNAELRRREGGEDGDLADIIERLPKILSEGGRGGSAGRHPPEMAGDVDHRLLTADLDRIIDADTLAQLPTMNAEEISAVAGALVELEHRVSARRRSIHDCMGSLQAEIVRRYKSGEATVDSLLA